jgi:hypothetical protein
VLVATAGVNAAILLDATTFLISAAILSCIPLSRSRAGSEGEDGFFRELKAGFGYLFGARWPWGSWPERVSSP